MPKKASTSKDRECAEECRSAVHALELISAITLPVNGVYDKQLACYFKNKCYNFAKVRDVFGRTLLHMAASCGRRDLCLWLLKTYAGNIDLPEMESGYTALHRSIAYGHINVAVALMKMNASVNVKDKEYFDPLDLALRHIDLSVVEYILHNKFPQNYNPRDPRFYKPDKEETTSSGKPSKRSRADYRKFVLQYNDKLSLLDRSCNAFATEVYAWGTNSNYTSGFGSASGKSHPEFLEFFERKNELIIEINLQKFHTLFVSLSGKVWSCGIGQGGRLGLPSGGTVLVPEEVLLTPSIPTLFCITVAAGQDHSVFLCNDNRIFVCGTNTYHQLGISPPPLSVIKPVQVTIDTEGKTILGVAASDYASVVWTSSTIFTCGLNAGQIGHSNTDGDTIQTFQKVQDMHFQSSPILTVSVSRAATLVATENSIFVLSNYVITRIGLKSIFREINDKEVQRQSRSYKKDEKFSPGAPLEKGRLILKLAVIGGYMDLAKAKLFSVPAFTEDLQVAVVLHDGSLYLYRNSTENLLRCYFVPRHDITVTDVILNSSGMLISSRKGEVFRTQYLRMINFETDAHNEFIFPSRVSRNDACKYCHILQVEKVEGAFRAVSIFSDPKGDNFAMLQHRSVDSITPIPMPVEDTLKRSLTEFYYETEDNDVFHDIIFKVGQKSFAAHKYILASFSEAFLSLEESNGVVVVNDMSSEVFQSILEFIYTSFCRIPKDSNSSTGAQNQTASQCEAQLGKTYQAAETFRIKPLQKYLQQIKSGVSSMFDPDSKFIINQEVTSWMSFDRLKFSSLYDMKLRSQDGAIFHAHKCILVARVEYFKNMLSGNWVESNDLRQEFNLPFNSAVISELLEYVYTDKISKSAEKRDMQFWSSMLVAADRFILMKLKELSERALSQYLNVRNVVDILILADVMNTDQLRIACFQFICLNLSSILYFRYLDRLDDGLLNQLTEYYRNIFSCRRFQRFPEMELYGTHLNIDEVFIAERLYPVDWDVTFDINAESGEFVSEAEKLKPKKIRKKLRKSTTSEIDNSITDDSKSDGKEYFGKRSATMQTKENLLTEHEILNKEWFTVEQQLKILKDEWEVVDRQLRSVKSRLKVNAAVKECPQLIEQKENYIPLKVGKPSVCNEPFTKSELNIIPHEQMSPNDSNYSIDINFSKLTPKISQAERKRLRRVSESSKYTVSPSSPENSDKDKTFTELTNAGAGPSSPLDCWKTLRKAIDQPTSFSSIMASEAKQKSTVIKVTKKIETKSLHSTQIEEQAIQELMAFYNVNGVYDEYITVQRVTHNISAPQWVTK